MEGSGEKGGQDRPDDEDHLVEHGLEGECGVEQRRVVEPECPAGPYGRSGQGEAGTNTDGGGYAHGQRPREFYGDDEHGQTEIIDQGRQQQHARLANTVNDTSPQWRYNCGGQRDDGGDQPGLAERARGQRHQQHDSDAGHRQRQPCHEAGQTERARPAVRQYLSVPAKTRGHDCPPRTQKSRLWVITPQALTKHRPTSCATHSRRTRRSCWCPSAALNVRRT
jgi:hypothetical protein